MKRQTFIITRFSYRGTDAFAAIDGPSFYRQVDPLDPDRLAQRFMLFRMSCLPSLAAQSDPDFTWVIVIDRDLPARFHDELQALTADIARVVLFVFDPAAELATLDWLAPYMDADTTHVITMNMDDDDVLPSGYVAWIHADVDHCHQRGELPPAKLLGSDRIKQWDLIISPVAPLGWLADWHRKDTIAATGLSICCERAAGAGPSTIGIRHVSARAVFDHGRDTDDQNALFWRKNPLIQRLADWPAAQCTAFTGGEIAPVLMLNHSSNDQAGRLWVDKSRANRTRVGRHTLDDYPLDWTAIHSYRKHFSIFRTGYLAQKITAKVPSALLWRIKRVGRLFGRRPRSA